MLGQFHSEDDTCRITFSPFFQALEAAGLHIVGQFGYFSHSVRVDALDHHPRDIGLGREHHLVEDEWGGVDHALDLLNLLRHLLKMIHTFLTGLEEDKVSLSAQDFFLEGLFKTAHHGQHNDQGHHSHHDPADGDDCDDGNES